MRDKNDKALREGLHVLLLHTDPAEVIRDWLAEGRSDVCRQIPGSFGDKLVRRHPERYSRDDGRRMAEILRERYAGRGALGVFGLIFDFARETMVEREGQPLVRYEQVLRWRDTVQPLGSLPFIGAFLAGEDVRDGRERQMFSFDPVPRTDNRRLRAVLDRGMAENHFHLKGSAPPYHLSWISLMNDPSGRRDAFARLENQQLTDSVEALDRPLYVLAVQAAVIRAFLFCRLRGLALYGPDTASVLRELLEVETQAECSWRVGKLRTAIESLRAVCGVPVDGRFKPDYAVEHLAGEGRAPTFDCFAGEYAFQYRMFSAILEGREEILRYADLFYAYLIISIRFRSELVQSNANFGFDNFSAYDRRKGIFLDGRPEFERMQVAVAAMTNLNDSRVRALEARIVPDVTPEGISDKIRTLEGIVAGANQAGASAEGRMCYVLHIPKRRDRGTTEPAAYLHSRDARLRRVVREVVDAVAALREGCDPTALLIRGLDACANEADTRPEAFAVDFRRIKRHQPRQQPTRAKEAAMVNLTYHVGEDFPDLVDGLRAVWEAVEFLELGRCDRIGHGLVLGIDPELWYARKQARIFISRQALLDNCAWMLKMMERFGAADVRLEEELRQECTALYAMIYQETMPDPEREYGFDASNYFSAMELRGDDPLCYREYQNAGAFRWSLEHHWKAVRPFCLRRDMPSAPLYEVRRYNAQAIRLFHHYHFNPETKRRGDEMVEHHVSRRYIRAAAELQRAMRGILTARGIGIECNPSSNVCIGNFNRYDRHPILTFHSQGLLEESGEAMFVSVNTDDQGVFDTSLENEYALLARGLEQIKDEDGEQSIPPDRIYRWLDHIREMGLEQSFLNDRGV